MSLLLLFQTPIRGWSAVIPATSTWNAVSSPTLSWSTASGPSTTWVDALGIMDTWGEWEAFTWGELESHTWDYLAGNIFTVATRPTTSWIAVSTATAP